MRKTLSLLCFVFASSLALFAQGVFVPPQTALKVVNGYTTPVANATITVCAAGAGGIPCSPALVGAIFKDAALTQPLSNPFTADAFGNYQFAVAAGTYTVTTTASGFVGNSYQVSTTSGASGGGGTPGGANTQIQYNCTGAFCGVTTGPSGSILTVGGNGVPGWQAGNTYAATANNWSQSSTTALTANTPGTVVLTPCPAGIDYTSGAGYQVYINDANAEAVSVTSGSSGSGNCSITFTPFFSHTSYAIGSASSGIQESINLSCGISGVQPFYNSQCDYTIPSNGPSLTPFTQWSLNNYNVYGTIFWHANQSTLHARGVSINALGRGPALQIGDRAASGHYQNNTVEGLAFRSPTNYSGISAYNGVNITNTSAASGYATITTATAHNFRPGDLVVILFTDSTYFWGDALVADCGSGAAPAACTGSSTTFRYLHATAVTSAATPGVVALAYEAILDNGMNSHFVDIQYDNNSEAGHFNNFFDFWDDENATVEHFNNNAINLNRNQNWTGSFVFSGGQANWTFNFAPVITVRDSTITANGSNGVTDFNSNGLYLENTVIQAQGLWQVHSANDTGGFQGASLRNTYSETSNVVNPLSPIYSPFYGLGTGGLIAGRTSSGQGGNYTIQGAGPLGVFSTNCGTGTTPLTYYIVANDVTLSAHTSPMRILDCLTQAGDNPVVRWPRIANGADTITYDVIRMTTPVNVGDTVPSSGNCGGGSSGICGSVATGITQSTACAGTLICTYTDTGIPNTLNYTVQQGNYGFFGGQINFWPGSIVAVNKTVSTDVEVTPTVGVGLSGQPAQAAKICLAGGDVSPGGYTACLASLTQNNNSQPNQTATLLTDGTANTANTQTLTKGRLSFQTTPYIGLKPHHFITLIDSQPGLTQGTIGYRPPANLNDVWIGTDVPSAGVALNFGQLAFGAPVSISHYIGHTGDGVTANWLERLTASLKEFNVPVQLDQGAKSTGAVAGYYGFGQGTAAGTNANTAGLAGPTTVPTGYNNVLPSAALTGYIKGSITANQTGCTASSTNECLQFVSTIPRSDMTNPTQVLFVASDVVISSTSLSTITGLSFTFPANTVLNASIDCDLVYNQQTAAVSDTFGFTDAGLGATYWSAQGSVQTAAGVYADGNTVGAGGVTPTNIVSLTPSAITTLWNAHLHLMVEQPSGASSLFSIQALTSNASDSITIKRDSKCVVNFQ